MSEITKCGHIFHKDCVQKVADQYLANFVLSKKCFNTDCYEPVNPDLFRKFLNLPQQKYFDIAAHLNKNGSTTTSWCFKCRKVFIQSNEEAAAKSECQTCKSQPYDLLEVLQRTGPYNEIILSLGGQDTNKDLVDSENYNNLIKEQEVFRSLRPLAIEDALDQLSECLKCEKDIQTDYDPYYERLYSPSIENQKFQWQE